MNTSFNEASSDTLMLMDVMATSRVDKVARKTDLTSSQQEVEKDTAGLCTRRREMARQTEVAMRRQREDQQLAMVRDHHLLRWGHTMV